MDQSLEIQKYVDIALRRKYWVIIPFLLTLLAGGAYALRAPKVYEARTLILVQGQSVPENLVAPIVAESVEDRLRTISEQVMSRTNLERIIKEYGLYQGSESESSLDAQVASVKRRIRIDVSTGRRTGTSSFTIAFRGKNPKKVMRVANALASNFIAENLKIREDQALGTSAFLADELNSVKARLIEKEEELKIYREKHMGALPQHLNKNLRMLEGFQGQVEQFYDALRDAENRKLLVQQAIDEIEKGEKSTVSVLPGQEEEDRDLGSLKSELALLEAKYTERHPDVIRLKKMIEKLESQETGVLPKASGEEAAFPEGHAKLLQQLNAVNAEIANLRRELQEAKNKAAWYQKKVEETPKREIELIELQRDYDNLVKLYDSLLNRKLEAEIAVSMERKQKGEQFRVIDPAKIPTTPVEPDMRKILMMVLVLGVGVGGGLAYLVELMDSSYKDPDDVEKELKVPVLVSLPLRYTEQEIKRRRIKETLKAASVAIGFVVCAVGVVMATKGVDKTVQYIKTVLEKI
jgi:polysaccharide chain length determinant protein (PEP-CTERM system associated)